MDLKENDFLRYSINKVEEIVLYRCNRVIFVPRKMISKLAFMHKFPLKNPYCEGKEKLDFESEVVGHESNWHSPSY